jgi:hypothetical protein
MLLLAIQRRDQRAQRVAVSSSACTRESGHALLLPLLSELVQGLLAKAGKLELLPRANIH